MDRNLFLAFALSFAVLLLWTVFVEPPPAPPPPAPPGEEVPAAPEAPVAAAEPQELPPLEPGEAAPALPVAQPEPLEAETLEVETPLFRAELSSLGGGITRWELRRYHEGPDRGRQPVTLTTGDPPYATALATPFDELGLGDLSGQPFSVEQSTPEQVEFRLVRDGVSVVKAFRFDPEDYRFELRLRVENRSDRAVAPRFALGWPAAERPGQDFQEQGLAVLHEGSVERERLQGLGTGGFFGGAPEKVLNYPLEVDWAGAETTYFLAAMLPDSPSQASARFVSLQPGKSGLVQLFFDPVQLGPGQSAERVYQVYVGPKEPERLQAAGASLERSIDEGWSWLVPLTRAFGWLLSVLYSLIPNYGVAIIVLTILVRVVTAPLTNKQMRSMERMRAISPKLQEIKEKHGDDRQKQSEEMMRLYRQEGVNPLGGCLPMLLQLPVFIGLFYALRSSIQLRQAPFVGWIQDLSSPESLFTIPLVDIPFRVLPVVMGATMVLQQRITPMQQMDPAQQKMMMTVMPIVMTVVFYQFPSGLVLYWMVSNVLAIAHQLWIGRNIRGQAA